MTTFRTQKGTDLPLMNIKGKDYLQVAYRLVWFNEQMPTCSITTEIIERTKDSCLFKATIWTKEGQVLSTAHKYEDRQGFGDFIEKAETGAIGRALALIGFGTQFCADELDEGSRLSDSPVHRQVSHVKQEFNHTIMATERDRDELASFADENGVSKAYIKTEIGRLYAVNQVTDMTKHQFEEFFAKLEADVLKGKQPPQVQFFDDQPILGLTK